MSTPLPRRLFLSATLGCIAVGVLVILGMRSMRPAIIQAAMEYHLQSIDFDPCHADPSTWGWASGDVSSFAYDRAGRSLNPNAPPLEKELLQRALGKESKVVVSQTSPRHLIFVAVRAPDGPCSVLRLTSIDHDAVISPRMLRVLTTAILLGMFLAILGTWWLVVRPLQARIEEIAQAAQGVGSDAFAAQPQASDALGHIADALATSHVRILESQRALTARNHALEHHLAGVAHDLRTPLASIHLALEALANGSQGPIQEEARRALADAVFLSSMVENLHQGARLRHEFDVTSGHVELTDLVRRLEKRFSIVGRHVGVEVGASTPEREVWVACTPALAERAVANLVQNAIEHNQAPGHVAITLSLLDEGTRFLLVVADDGPGMAEEALASLQHESFLFDEARPRGPGMGTLITREVARRAGWSVRFSPLEPRGLEVRLEGTLGPPP